MVFDETLLEAPIMLRGPMIIRRKCEIHHSHVRFVNVTVSMYINTMYWVLIRKHYIFISVLHTFRRNIESVKITAK